MSKVKYIAEGGSSNRQPLFDGSYYYFWKGKIKLFLRSQDNVQKENILLKKEVEELKNDLTCFIKSIETFQNILGSQSKSAEKSCLGFKDPNKNLIKSFVPQKVEMKLKCSYCDRLGHDDSLCYHKTNFIRKNKINLSSERSHLSR